MMYKVNTWRFGNEKKPDSAGLASLSYSFDGETCVRELKSDQTDSESRSRIRRERKECEK